MRKAHNHSAIGGICIVAGEASGDMQASLLVQAMIAKQDDNSFWGIAGPCLRKVGVEPIIDTEDLAVMGIYEVLKHYLTISAAYKKLLYTIITRKPKLIILVDYPGFNLRFAGDATRLGFKVVYYIPPKVWSHGYSRVERLKKYTSLLLTILPFETAFFKNAGLNSIFVGNPLFDEVKKYFQNHEKIEAQNKIQVINRDQSFIIGLLPGSRKAEIERLLPIMIEAFIKLSYEFPHMIGHIPVAQTLSLTFVKDIFEKTCQKLHIDSKYLLQKIKFFEGRTYDVMHQSHYAWVCSGTATLETAFFKTPHCAVYKLSTSTGLLARLLLKVKYVSLVNLCMDKEVIPEFLQSKATSENLVLHAKEMLTNQSKRETMIAELVSICDLFPENAAQHAATAIVSLMTSEAS